MKISKLFHWLYAILMLLPILVFIPNAFYYGFNETAVAQQKVVETPVFYESNELVNYQSFVSGNAYRWNDSFYGNSGLNNRYLMQISNITFDNGNTYQSAQLYANGNSVGIIPTQGGWVNIQGSRFNFVFGAYIDDVDFYTLMPFFASNYNYVASYETTTTNMSITDSMSYAWQSTWQNDLFSWSYDSFLTQPFLYITNLFNVPATNTLLYCLSYWLNISIIWLVFDVVMYVPLLVHRWLDKGIVE